jgi:hypothetical protein
MPKRARMVISCDLMPPQGLALDESSVPAGSVAHATIVAADPKQDLTSLGHLVQEGLESSYPSAPHGINAVGVVLDSVSKATSSDNLKTVMGILEKFVQIGDQIAEVSLSLPSLDLLS